MFVKKIINKLVRLIQKPQLPFQLFENLSYSQSGEDIIIDYIFRLRKISLPTFIDLGSNHPFSLNNTFLFYKRGSRGVNVDANANLIKLFDQYRPQDKNINLGVSDKAGQLDFYIISDPALSTFLEEEALMHQNYGRTIIAKIPVQMKSIDSIVYDYCGGVYPDLVSIDVEGLDYLIIASMNLTRSKPKVICIETVEFTSNGTGKKRVDLIKAVVNKGYTLYADTNINSIFVENNFWFNYSNH